MPKLLNDKGLAAQLTAERKRRGWTQGELGERMVKPDGKHATQGEVSRWESGEISPQYSTVVMWADALGVDVSIFMERDPERDREAPAPQNADWLPRLMELVLTANLSDGESRTELMAHINAAARLQNALWESAAAYRRAGAMQLESHAAGERASGMQEEAKSASVRALTLKEKGDVAPPLSEEEAIAAAEDAPTSDVGGEHADRKRAGGE